MNKVYLKPNGVIQATLTPSVVSQSHTDLYQLAKKDGFKGTLEEFLGSLKGENGATFVPSIENGILKWTNNKDLPNPEPFTLDDSNIDEFVEHILNHG